MMETDSCNFVLLVKSISFLKLRVRFFNFNFNFNFYFISLLIVFIYILKVGKRPINNRPLKQSRN